MANSELSYFYFSVIDLIVDGWKIDILKSSNMISPFDRPMYV